MAMNRIIGVYNTLDTTNFLYIRKTQRMDMFAKAKHKYDMIVCFLFNPGKCYLIRKPYTGRKL
jgi:hypothetical protein